MILSWLMAFKVIINYNTNHYQNLFLNIAFGLKTKTSLNFQQSLFHPQNEFEGIPRIFSCEV